MFCYHVCMQENTSMLPLISPDDQIIIDKAKSIHTNDIIAFKDGENIIAHRVLYFNKKKNHYICKGDSNSKIDKPVKLGQILGKVNSIVRNGVKTPIKHLYFTQTTQFLSELKKIHKIFEKNKISYAAIKGYPASLAYTKKPVNHIFHDLDILIKKTDIKRVASTLIRHDYKIVSNNIYSYEEKIPAQFTLKKDSYPFDIYIDVHLIPSLGFAHALHLNSFFPNHNKIARYFLKNTSKIEKEYIILNPEAQLINLLLHFYHHNFESLHKLEILFHIVPRISWKKFLKDIKKLDLEPYIHPSILIFDKHYSGIFPNKIVSLSKRPKSRIITFIFTKIKSPFNKTRRIPSGIIRLSLAIFLSKNTIKSIIKIISNKKTYQLVFTSVSSTLFNKH